MEWVYRSVCCSLEWLTFFVCFLGKCSGPRPRIKVVLVWYEYDCGNTHVRFSMTQCQSTTERVQSTVSNCVAQFVLYASAYWLATLSYSDCTISPSFDLTWPVMLCSVRNHFTSFWREGSKFVIHLLSAYNLLWSNVICLVRLKLKCPIIYFLGLDFKLESFRALIVEVSSTSNPQ